MLSRLPLPLHMT
uniref:Uncharacterized protein n=1 Tax=Vitis vinifera TaxID=29760 RepID=F6HAR4_VITVI